MGSQVVTSSVSAGPTCRGQRFAGAVLSAVALAGAPGVAVPGVAVPGIEGHPAWVRPVEGPVVEAFDAPTRAYGPGHRGVDFAAPPGTPVRAAGSGTVAFAGAVAGSLHVVVAHEGGLRTSYSFLERVLISTGRRVDAGQVVGLAGGSGSGHAPGVLHFGLRAGDRYVDPMALFGPVDLTRLVRLVPTDERDAAPWTTPSAEAAALRNDLGLVTPAPGGPGFAAPELADAGCGDGIPLVGGAISAICDGAEWVAGQAVAAFEAGISLLGDAARAGARLVANLERSLRSLLDRLGAVGVQVRKALLATPLGRVLTDLVEIGQRFLDWTSRVCTSDAPPADGTGGSGHHVLAVGGVDSEIAVAGGPSFELDVDALGYRDGEVSWFSYTEAPTYSRTDTYGDLRQKARLLGEQLRDLQRANPGREVDLVAHSQGGVVVDLFLQRVYDPADPSYPPIGTVVTLAAPHEGAPLATAARQIRTTRTGRAVLDAIDGLELAAPSSSVAVRQLDEMSPLMRRLWNRRLPEQLEITSIGGTDDVIVPANRIGVPGGVEVVVAVAGLRDHSAIPDDPRALQAVRAALERRAPPCTTLLEGIRGALEPVIISRVERNIGEIGKKIPWLVP